MSSALGANGKSQTFNEDNEIAKFIVDEDHFSKAKPNGSVPPDGKVDELKQPEDEVVNNDFDEAMSTNSELGVAARPERVSNVVQEVTIDDFEFIRFLGDGAYGKVNLVR